MFDKWFNRKKDLANEKYAKAIAELDRAIHNSPLNPQLLQKRAAIHESVGNFQQAHEDLQQAIEVDPNFTDAYISLGILYGKFDELSAAIQCFSTAIQLDPTNADSYYNRGNIYAMQKEHYAAIRDYSRLLKPEPDNLNAYVVRGLNYEHAGEVLKAIDDYEFYLRMAPSAESIHKIQGRVKNLRSKLNGVLAY